MAFPFLTVFIIFIVWLAIRLRSVSGKRQQSDEDFWTQEKMANATPARDIDNLNYITIPLDKFPLHFSQNPDVVAMEDRLAELSTHRLLNLTGKTNTELKATYGVPNFNTMSQIGADFDEVTVLINSYAKAVIEELGLSQAQPILEFAVGIGTDVSESYELLADCYKAAGNTTKLEYLQTQVANSNLLLKETILSHIGSSTSDAAR